MSDLVRITVRSKPIEVFDSYDEQDTRVVETAIATKDGINVRVRSDEMVAPDSEVYFYVKLEHAWQRPGGGNDYDEFVTSDGEIFYTAFRSLGKQRIVFNHHCVSLIQEAIRKFVAELTSS